MAEAGLPQKAAAEFIGVMALVLIGGGAIISTGGSMVDRPQAAMRRLLH